jgi:ankyrin repeat protein
MKHILITTIAAVVLVGCGQSQQSATSPEAKPVEPVAGAKAPDISIREAAESGNIEAVRQHIAAGTDVNAADGDKYGTPLHQAFSKGHNEIVSLLRKHGGTMYNLEGWEKPEAKPVESVAEAAKTDQSPVKTSNISIHAAVRTKNIVAVKQHLAAGTDVNVKDDKRMTPLDVALLYKLTETADFLRKHGGKTSDWLD